MPITIRGTDPIQPPGIATLFAGGFRPFFLFAAIDVVFGITVWVSRYLGGPALRTRWPGWWWHGHEMVFGFFVAAIAGFILTAVPKWTNSDAPRGWPLAGLVGAWVVARAAAWGSMWVPELLVLLADQLMLVPLLGWTAARIFASRSQRNYGVPALLLVLAVADLLFHLQVLGVFTASKPFGIQLAIDAVIVLVTLISGRITPAFTEAALRRRSPPGPTVVTRPRLGIAALVAVTLALVLDLAVEGSPVVGLAAVVAAVLLIARAIGWQLRASASEPIVGILHLGHAWLIVGFVLLAGHSLLDLGSRGAAVHAFTAGAIATMILAVTTRASLGHSGRTLELSRWTVLGYVLISVGALVRVLASVVAGVADPAWIGLAGGLWGLAFVVFVGVYWPVLTRPRVDGRPG